MMDDEDQADAEDVREYCRSRFRETIKDKSGEGDME